MTASATSTTTQTGFFNLHINGLGYLNNIREIEGRNSGSMLCCTLNALSGSTEKPEYTRFDIVVTGKEAKDLVKRCRKAVAENKKVLVGFRLSNLTHEIFTLTKGEHAGEQRVSLKARLIKVDWVKIGTEMVHKSEKAEEPVSTPVPDDAPQPAQAWSADQF
ncbi:STY4534 family ICE replication protein [Serratia fonticola]